MGFDLFLFNLIPLSSAACEVVEAADIAGS